MQHFSRRYLLTGALTLVAALATVASAHTKPIYNVSGTWTGTAHSSKHKGQTQPITGTFSTTDPSNSTFDGTFSVTTGGGNSDFTITGTVTASGKLTAMLTPVGGSGGATIKGTINAKKNTISGTFSSPASEGNGADHGTFKLTKS